MISWTCLSNMEQKLTPEVESTEMPFKLQPERGERDLCDGC